ncbi:MAG: Rne/Rng family ribonuclease [Paludibacter sp.]|nr:Rne/Rng family ribonuclease [Bacteroidales bacterium]MCM1069508.1 Rne/Rng family ribonuclease [Prevotella sp.]MCM1354164.1 Rne/Rng family ribonuclease [Bacteroides sp.]MCM1442979.1 Rne/Rng family ribonuclease [Muribaculum sp.]MCM1482239.1 Rne/Rng family ribonuclease [Paludibacter sp.]
MKSELVVDVQPTEISVALLEDDRLSEINRYKREKTFAVGNIYLGKVKKVMPALNAVFVDVGYEKDAFLHYLDLGAGFLRLNGFTQSVLTDGQKKASMSKFLSQPEVGKEGRIADFLTTGQEILVQVSKEPINTKGPRLTAEISLAGRNMVLIPFAEKVMVSNKIKSESERSRLRQLVQSIKPNGFGVIVRTVAEGKRVAELDGELKLLSKRWEETVAKLQPNKGATLVSEEIGRAIGIIRDVFNPTFCNIQVNDEDVCNEIRTYVELIAPECADIVHLYNGTQPVFDNFNVTRQMKTGLGRTVSFKNGGYLIIERTEALFSIDVNSGSKKQGDDQEENAFNVNMLAAEEIVHQLRLRDIGGIIIIDFIDLSKAEHRQALYEHMVKLMGLDRAKHNVLPLSKFGLMQITRQRVRPAVEVDLREVCPTCLGKGKIQPSLLFTDTLEEEIEAYTGKFGKNIYLYVHPYVFAYADRGLLSSLRSKWKRKFGVKLIPDQQLGLLQYRFTDTKKNELTITEDSKKK